MQAIIGSSHATFSQKNSNQCHSFIEDLLIEHHSRVQTHKNSRETVPLKYKKKTICLGHNEEAVSDELVEHNVLISSSSYSCIQFSRSSDVWKNIGAYFFHLYRDVPDFPKSFFAMELGITRSKHLSAYST